MVCSLIIRLGLLLTLAFSAAACDGGDPGNLLDALANSPSSPCQAAAHAAGECGSAYMAAMDMEMPEHDGEEAPACVDDVSTDLMYDCMAAAYSAGDCSTMDGMMNASETAQACSEAN